MITLGSLFDGSGGFPLAGALYGAHPLWAAEIEPYPIAVTRSRFPQMQHLGDVLKIDGAAIPPVDIITFGSPCQDMSVAGKRAGMNHTEHGGEETTRSGLFYEAVRIIREMRNATNGKYPTFAVWENVLGAFTSNKGHDFRCVLEELQKICGGGYASVPLPQSGKWTNAGEIVADGFSIAWRVLDAQYWGVPQRRRRIYLVADFAGEHAGKILFERESVSRYFKAGGASWEGTADDIAGSAGGSDRVRRLDAHDAVFSLQDKATRFQGGGNNRNDDGAGNGLGISDGNAMYTLTAADRHAVAFMAGQGAKARSLGTMENCSPTLKASPSGLNQVPTVVVPSVFHSLTATNARNPESAQRANCVVYDARGNGDGKTVPTITGDHNDRVTDYTSLVCMAHGQANAEVEYHLCSSLTCNHEQPIIAHRTKPPRKYIVRRLTPTECARLQGFPDEWGAPDARMEFSGEEVSFWENVRKVHAEVYGKAYKPYKDARSLLKWYNKLHTDSAEYKMWGNGIALPCAAFVIGGCIAELEVETR